MDDGRRATADWATLVGVSPRRLLPAVAVLTAALLAVTGVTAGWRAWVTGSPAGPAAATGRSDDGPVRSRPGPAGGPAAVLAAWDARRAEVWARGDAGALRRLYAAGSGAGEADVRLLDRYTRRGLRVVGLQTQVLDLEVLAREERRLLLAVTDRVVGGEAVGAGGRWPLPSDRPSTRHVELVRAGGAWLVARVDDPDLRRAQPRAAARTSRTSRSSKS